MCHGKSGNQIRYVPSSRVYEYLKLEKSERMSGNLNLKHWTNVYFLSSFGHGS